jgi:flagellar basal-body rod protein FlgG
MQLQGWQDSPVPPAPLAAVPVVTSGVDLRQGGIVDTGVATNLALDGPGSFVAQGPNGEIQIRGGSFTLDSTGKLVTKDGYPVLGEKGPIQIGANDWTVSENGEIRSNGAVVDKIRVDRAPADQNKPVRVVAASIEGSNVNTVEEMVSMITALRAYEANQKSIQSIDSTLDKVINQMNRA